MTLKVIKAQKGVILLYAAVVGSIILLVGLSIIALVVSEVRLSGRVDDSVRAFYAAESGVEYAVRWITDGGTLDASSPNPALRLCRNPKNFPQMEPSFDPIFSTGVDHELFNWKDLTVLKVTAGGAQFLRIRADGYSSGAKRTVVFDITPRCDFSDASGFTGPVTPDDATIQQVFPS